MQRLSDICKNNTECFCKDNTECFFKPVIIVTNLVTNAPELLVLNINFYISFSPPKNTLFLRVHQRKR